MPILARDDGLFELTGADMARARDLFAAAPANAHGFLFAVLEGNHVGRIFVDDPDAPTAALAHLLCEFTFLVGATDAAFAAAVRDLLFTELAPAPAPYGQLLFLVPTTEAWAADVDQRYADRQIDHIHRKTFTFDRDRYAARHAGWERRVPEGFSVRTYDHPLAESAGGLDEFWSGLDAFLARGLGYAVMHGETPAARCHTVFVGAGEGEISIETDEAYRRRGFATLAACAFIDAALARGLTPAWSCWFDNDPSIALAERLGFVPAQDMPMEIVFIDKPSNGQAPTEA